MNTPIHYIKNNSTAFSKILLVIGFSCALTASLTSGEGMEGIPWDYSYYHLYMICITCYLSSLFLMTVSNTPKWSKKWRTILLTIVLASLTTIGDEIAGTGTEVGLHDLCRFAGVLVIVAIQRYKLIAKCKNYLKGL